MSVSRYQTEHTFEKRTEESAKIIKKYTDRVPIIVLKHETCGLPDIDKNKYLVPRDMSLSQFVFVIRKRVHLKASESLFITINQRLMSGSTPIDTIYDELKDPDGFIYIVYTSENTFG